MKDAKEGHASGVKELSTEMEQIDRAIALIDKQISSTQSNLIDFLKSHNIPYQVR